MPAVALHPEQWNIEQVHLQPWRSGLHCVGKLTASVMSHELVAGNVRDLGQRGPCAVHTPSIRMHSRPGQRKPWQGPCLLSSHSLCRRKRADTGVTLLFCSLCFP